MATRELKLGDIIEVPNPALVTRPDGNTVRVIDGVYVVEQDGKHKVEKA